MSCGMVAPWETALGKMQVGWRPSPPIPPAFVVLPLSTRVTLSLATDSGGKSVRWDFRKTGLEHFLHPIYELVSLDNVLS